MILDPDFLTHWKTRALIGALDDKCAPLYLIALWSHCQNRRRGEFDDLTPTAIKGICGFEGEAESLEKALIEVGFAERISTGAFVVSGWAEKNAQLLAAWENGAKGGRPAKYPRDNPVDNPSTNPGDTRVEKSREEKSREEKKTKGTRPKKPIELPPILDTPEFRSALDSWLDYKGSGAYKPRGLSSLLSQAAKRAEAFGLPAVLNAFEVAMGNGWAGWNQDGSFKQDANSDPRGNLAMRNRLREKMRK